LAKMASTYSGMRKILKRDLPVQKYIRMAVETGIYTPQDDENDPRPPRGKKAQLPQRGLPHDMNEQLDYPLEYEILTLNPPMPELPRIPKKLRKEQQRSTHLPTDRLIRNYVRRYDMRMRTAHPLTDAQKEEKMYAKVLGLSQDDSGDDYSDTAMGRKQMVLNHAYNFAIKQYEVLRMGEAEGMTEEESVEVVEELLAKEAREERSKSRALAKEATKWRNAPGRAEEGEAEVEGRASTRAGERASDDGPGSTTVPVNSVPSILAGKPRTIRAMTMWARRLAAVPYDRWTLGAATALDHWIACEVLGMSELSWKAALRGDAGEDEEVMTGRLAETVGGDHHSEGVGVGNAARVKDIVTVRTALFPETVLFAEDEGKDAAGSIAGLGEEEPEEEVDATQRSIDELLASLGGFDEEEPEEEIGTAGGTEDEEAEHDAKVAMLVDELQEWRTKNAEAPYDQWSSGDKEDFNTWLSQYIAILTTDSDGPVDMEATREALLSEPPLSRDESEKYWSSIADETEGEIYLQDLLAKGPPPQKDGESASDRRAREDMETFLSLPYERQLRKLVDMGTLRPVFDEYASESDRAAFLRRHAASLMEGMEVEHLVSDPSGPIRAEDVGAGDLLEDEDVKRGGRYRIEMVKYGSDEYGTIAGQRARDLWRVWNAHKAGRAMYEEAMFKKGKLGLADDPEEASKKKGKKKRKGL